ncbi:MAG: bifunctional demethylmenaquinone methyltransferase/2-methoxy-6-polyprenyl-1,4-benzoquinol methylase UbiE [Tannerellaceae bacterium]|jgi:demethylmenaquinone methyltransferase/2-methoxy-6-polyprenyl-1,4-benzoquinol methylase|nr:bifunctional demethylmenaquinone methyltransferase/2-methoxy-6-polyprenyl-1,4-benzoquinol methylase UbiE [Tannerellaceae bacterium]
MVEKTLTMPLKVESILPYDKSERKGRQIEQMFDGIASAYDRLNCILSLGLDAGWRRKAASTLSTYSPARILDLAAGTGDMALTLSRILHPEHITAVDISENMLSTGKMKALRAGYSSLIDFERQDCMSLTFPDESFDAVTIAFGLRNFENIEQGLSEMRRVLKPGGRLLILELSTPDAFPFKQLYTLYTNTAVPLAARLMSADRRAYRYLPQSVQALVQGEAMRRILEHGGFTETSICRYTFGVCTLYSGKKN